MEAIYKKHITFLSLPTIIAIVSSVLLILEFSQDKQNQASDALVLATTEVIIGDVKRKINKRFSWDAIAYDNDLFENDLIRTVKNSRVRIKFKDGSVIEMGENSLISISKSEESLSINFIKGDLEAKVSKSKINIKSKDVHFNIDSSDAKVQIKADGTGQAKVKVENGTANLVLNGKKLSVEQGQLATINENQAIDVKDIALTTVFPVEKDYHFSRKEINKINFKWEIVKLKNKKTAQLIIEKKSKKTFKRFLTKDIQIADKNYEATLGPGQYRWYMAIDNQKVTDKVSFSLAAKIPIELLSPSKNFTRAIDPFREEDLEIKWNGPEYLYVYRYEVAKDRAFKNVLIKKLIKRNEKVYINMNHLYDNYLKSTNIDSLFFRIVGEKPLQPLTQYSSNIMGHFSSIKKINLKGPLNERRRDLYLTNNANVNFTWDKVSGAKSYKVISAKDENFFQELAQHETDSNQLNLTITRPRSYYWKVEGLDQEGRLLGRSQVFLFDAFSSLVLNKMEVHAPADKLVRKSITPKDFNLLFEWAPDPKAQEYVLMIRPFDSQSQQQTFIKTLKDNRFELIEWPAGKYIWSVKSRGSFNVESESSKERVFTVDRSDQLLQAPKLKTFKLIKKNNKRSKKKL